MYNVLKDWNVRSFSGGMLEIIKGGRTFTGSYFDDPENMVQLETLCRKFFERPISVRILPGNGPAVSSGPPPASKSSPESPPGAGKLQQGDPAGDVVRIFQGRVSADTRPKNPAETPGGLDSGPPDKEED
jgi:hypothetical protein